MNIERFSFGTRPTATWSGGTTTQLAIWPPEARYDTRDFLWRISSARVTAEESVFTSLPGVQRIILPLDGQLILQHDGHHSAVLQPFMQDAFSGDWTTRSYGRVQDFNVMYKTPCTATVQHLHLASREETELSLRRDEQLFLYCYCGLVTLCGCELAAGDSALLHPDAKQENVTILCAEAADLIAVKIGKGE